jgi:hypothetical protein
LYILLARRYDVCKASLMLCCWTSRPRRLDFPKKTLNVLAVLKLVISHNHHDLEGIRHQSLHERNRKGMRRMEEPVSRLNQQQHYQTDPLHYPRWRFDTSATDS